MRGYTSINIGSVNNRKMKSLATSKYTLIAMLPKTNLLTWFVLESVLLR